MALTRAQQAYRQWIDTYIVTKNPRHLKTAVACQRIASQEIAAMLAIFMITRAQSSDARQRRVKIREEQEQ